MIDDFVSNQNFIILHVKIVFKFHVFPGFKVIFVQNFKFFLDFIKISMIFKNSGFLVTLLEPF